MSGSGCKATKGGGSKSRSSSAKDAVVHSTKLQTKRDHLVTLRAALFDEDGGDRNVLTHFEAFRSFNRNGLDATVQWFTGKTFPRKHRDWAFKLAKDSLEPGYTSSNYGWDDEDKRDELYDSAARLLLVRDTEGTPLGFAQFRFTLQGEFLQRMEGLPTLFLYDLVLEERVRGHGLGKHLVQTLELCARKVGMSFMMTFVPAAPECERANCFFTQKLRGFTVDESFCVRFDEEQDDSFIMFSKCLDKKIIAANRQNDEVRALAQQLCAVMKEKQAEEGTESDTATNENSNAQKQSKLG